MLVSGSKRDARSISRLAFSQFGRLAKQIDLLD